MTKQPRWATGAAGMVLLALAGPVFAQGGCPVAADLGRGITVEYDDGSVERFRAGARPGVVTVQGAFAEGGSYELELGQGMHVLSTTSFFPDRSPDPASQVTYDYGRAPEALPVPVPGGRFDVASVATDQNGERPEGQSQAYGPAETLAIGDCAYAAVPVMIAYNSPLNYVESLSYLPELGIALLRSQQGGSETPRLLAPVAIRAGK